MFNLVPSQLALRFVKETNGTLWAEEEFFWKGLGKKNAITKIEKRIPNEGAPFDAKEWATVGERERAQGISRGPFLQRGR